MKKSSASLTPELWPKVAHVVAFRPPDGRLMLEIPSLSETPLLAALGYAIHHEMRAAGGWAAHLDEPRERDLPSAKDFFRYRAENASRLLALYTALRNIVGHARASDLTPDAMKEAATRSYSSALREAQANRHSEKKALA